MKVCIVCGHKCSFGCNRRRYFIALFLTVFPCSPFQEFLWGVFCKGSRPGHSPNLLGESGRRQGRQSLGQYNVWSPPGLGIIM